MRTLVIGDIHGGYKALHQCLERSAFDYKKDRLIALGDVADGWREVVECIEKLMKIKNLIYIIGNHDTWLIDWLKFGATLHIWTSQGGMASLSSYAKEKDMAKTVKRHIKFFDKAVYYFVDEDNRLYVHGGYNWHKSIDETSPYDMTWDRALIKTAIYWELIKKRTGEENKVSDYNEVFIGHTTTSMQDGELKPVHMANVWDLDQGAGWEGKLTIMDVETKEFWQSDIVSSLYPDEKGR